MRQIAYMVHMKPLIAHPAILRRALNHPREFILSPISLNYFFLINVRQYRGNVIFEVIFQSAISGTEQIKMLIAPIESFVFLE